MFNQNFPKLVQYVDDTSLLLNRRWEIAIADQSNAQLIHHVLSTYEVIT